MKALLEVQDLHKHFGGVVATDGVSLSLPAGEIHALIGPNGAGKTTLVAQLAGQLRSDRGHVLFDGHDITQLGTHQRAQRGLVRSFQITRLFKSFSVVDNVALALQAVSGSSLRAWRPVRAEAALFSQAQQMLDTLGLGTRAQAAVDELSHGEQRALEVGIALASQPRLVLLDEPMAGMGPQESGGMETLINSLRGRCTVLLIEHDVDAVFRLADRVSVLVGGRIIASGSPAAVRADAAVVAAYLGDDVGDAEAA
jgi:branched-chain amino acid transport system ATP-binding protein